MAVDFLFHSFTACLSSTSGHQLEANVFGKEQHAVPVCAGRRAGRVPAGRLSPSLFSPATPVCLSLALYTVYVIIIEVFLYIMK